MNPENGLSYPDDPLAMPPPYWRHSGATFQLAFALEELLVLLEGLLALHPVVDNQFDEYFKHHGREDCDEDLDNDECSNIANPLWELEHKVQMKADLIGFLSAVKVEEELNKFIVFNFTRDVAESIEKLSPVEKFLVVSALLGVKDAKSKTHYGEVKLLMTFRNAFAHGHCTDRPTRTLHHNHLIDPGVYPGVPDSLSKMKQHAWAVLNLTEYLEKITKNKYFAETRGDDNMCRDLLRRVGQYHIESLESSNAIYTIAKEKPAIE